MSEENKKDTTKEPAEETELSNQDLEQVAGGAGVTVNINKQKFTDKTF